MPIWSKKTEYQNKVSECIKEKVKYIILPVNVIFITFMSVQPDKDERYYCWQTNHFPLELTRLSHNLLDSLCVQPIYKKKRAGLEQQS